MPMEYRLGSLTQIPPGEGRTFKVGDREVAVFRTRQGELFATQAVCPHRGGPLADGLVGGDVLICPLHEWRFDLKTGTTPNAECAITVYPVRTTEAEEIVLTLDGGQPAPLEAPLKSDW